MPANLLRLSARYYRLYDEQRPYGCDESDFHYVSVDLAIPVEEVALVLVDLWSKHYCRSWTERAMGIVRDRIGPVAAACRRAGIPVLHAPSQRLADRYPKSSRLFREGDGERMPTYASWDSNWPPVDFVERRGEYGAFAREYSPPRESWAKEYEDQGISTYVGPEEDDWVVKSGPHMHRILTDLKRLHLIYAGFATNMCLLHRDYGIRAMSDRGYNTILLGDCTTAVEAHDTVDELLVTRIFVRQIEMIHSFSISSSQFLAALEA